MLSVQIIVLLILYSYRLNITSHCNGINRTIYRFSNNNDKALNGRYKRNSIDMEILDIEVLPDDGNSVYLLWGKPDRQYDLNWTFGVYYGESVEEASSAPKLVTKNLSAVVDDLDFCKQYVFAVGILDDNTTMGNRRPQLFRNIGTFADSRSTPENLQVDFLPAELPCLFIKWSASCPNIGRPLSYLLTVTQVNTSTMTIITVPKTIDIDLGEKLRVAYGETYRIKVSTDFPSANPTDIVTFSVPHFLQPYKVRLTSQPDGTFLMYWKENYIPYYIGPYYYEIYVYIGRDLSSKVETCTVNRPVFIYKGNETEYTFMVVLRSYNGNYNSIPTRPIVKALDGEQQELEL